MCVCVRECDVVVCALYVRASVLAALDSATRGLTPVYMQYVYSASVCVHIRVTIGLRLCVHVDYVDTAT